MTHNQSMTARFIEVAFGLALVTVTIRFTLSRDWSIVLLCGLIAVASLFGRRS